MARDLAEKLASKGPTKCVLDFTVHAERPWVKRFFEAHPEDSRPAFLRATVTDAQAVAAILEAFRRSSRLEEIAMDPVELMGAKRPMDYVRFDPSEPEVRGFRFLVEELRDKWGPEVADAIEPIYEQATAKYVLKHTTRPN
jgi:hypothetical protein